MTQADSGVGLETLIIGDAVELEPAAEGFGEGGSDRGRSGRCRHRRSKHDNSATRFHCAGPSGFLSDVVSASSDERGRGALSFR